MGVVKYMFFVLLGGWVVLSGNLLVPSTTLAGAIGPSVGTACGGEEGCLQGNINRIGQGELVINDCLYRIDPAAAIDLDRFAVGQIVAYRVDDSRTIIHLQLISKGEKTQTPAVEETSPPPPRRSGKDTEPRQKQGVWRN